MDQEAVTDPVGGIRVEQWNNRAAGAGMEPRFVTWLVPKRGTPVLLEDVAWRSNPMNRDMGPIGFESEFHFSPDGVYLLRKQRVLGGFTGVCLYRRIGSADYRLAAPDVHARALAFFTELTKSRRLNDSTSLDFVSWSKTHEAVFILHGSSDRENGIPQGVRCAFSPTAKKFTQVEQLETTTKEVAAETLAPTHFVSGSEGTITPKYVRMAQLAGSQYFGSTGRLAVARTADGAIYYALRQANGKMYGGVRASYQATDKNGWALALRTVYCWRPDGKFALLQERPSGERFGRIYVISRRDEKGGEAFREIPFDERSLAAFIRYQPGQTRLTLTGWNVEGNAVLRAVTQNETPGAYEILVSVTGASAVITQARPILEKPPATEAIHAFLHKHLEHVSSRNLDALAEDYDAAVDYFDKAAIPRAKVRESEADYYAQWPRGAETFTGRPEIRLVSESGGKRTFECTLVTQFRQENDAKAYVAGQMQNFYRLVEDDAGGFRISAQRGKILHVEKGMLPPAIATGPEVTVPQVIEFLRAHQQREEARNLAALAGDYAPLVQYEGKSSMPWAQILQAKLEYCQRWPTERDSLAGEIAVVKLGPRLFAATLPMYFYVENNRRDWIRGLTIVAFELRANEGRIQISSEHGTLKWHARGGWRNVPR